jgi:hypothetical protein
MLSANYVNITVILPTLLRQDHFIAIHILYIMYRWNWRQPTIRTRNHAACTHTSHASVHYRVQELRLYHYHVQLVHELLPQDAPAWYVFCQWILQQSAKDPWLYSWMDCASLGVGSLTFTMNMCNHMKILMWFNLISCSNSFLSTYGTEFHVTAS